MRKVGKGLCIYAWNTTYLTLNDLHEGDEILLDDVILLTIDEYDQKPFEDFIRREWFCMTKDTLQVQWEDYLKSLTEPWGQIYYKGEWRLIY